MKTEKRFVWLLVMALVLALLQPYPLKGQSTPWESVGPEGGYVASMAQDPSNGNVLYVAPYSYPCKIFKSTDHGQTWSSISTIPNPAWGLVVHRANSSILYANCSHEFRKSTDGGQSWTVHALPYSYTPRLRFFINDLILDPVNPNILHIAAQCWTDSIPLMAYLRSTDGGATWSYKTLTSFYATGRAVAVDPANPQNIYVGGYSIQSYYAYPLVMKSTNGGAEFSDCTSSISGTVTDLAFHPAASGKLYAVSGAGIYWSTNGGTSWTKNSGYVSSPYEIRFHPQTVNTLFVGAYEGVYKSTDAGVNWSKIASGIIGTGYGGFAVESSAPSWMFFANTVGIFRTSDGGSTWQSCNCGFSCGRITAISLVPSSPTTMYAAMEYNAIYKATGATSPAILWQRIPVFYGCTDVNSIVIPPTDPNRIYAMEGGG